MAKEFPINMPKFGLSMTSGLIAEWLVKPGAAFKKGDAIVAIETEKIVNELEAPSDGVLKSIAVEAGGEALVADVIGVWALENSDDNPLPVSAGNEAETVAVSAPVVEVAPVAAVSVTSASSDIPFYQRKPSTPSARYLARQLDIDINAVPSSSPSGRIKKHDVAVFHTAGGAAVSTALQAPLSQSDSSSQTASPAAGVVSRKTTHFEKSLARRLQQSKNEAPHFYLMTDVAADDLMNLRSRFSQSPTPPKITFTHFFIAALAKVLSDNPAMNRVWRGETIDTYESINIGLAVNTDNGLLAPVVRNVGGCSLGEIAQKVNAVIDRARNNRLQPDDSGDAAFTLSNGGMFDITYMVPIITPGQSAILGTGSFRQIFKPDAQGKPVLANTMGIAMSFDHRVFSGVEGIEIINAVKQRLEDPISLLM